MGHPCSKGTVIFFLEFLTEKKTKQAEQNKTNQTECNKIARPLRNESQIQQKSDRNIFEYLVLYLKGSELLSQGMQMRQSCVRQI